MSAISRFNFLIICIAIPFISVASNYSPSSAIHFSYSQLHGIHFQPKFGLPQKGIVLKPELIDEKIEFQFYEDYILYTIDCYTTKLYINSIKVYNNNHSKDSITSAIKVKIQKNKDLKIGFREIYIFLIADGTIDHIEFGAAKLYENRIN